MFIILEPWNYEPLKEFLEAKYCYSKFKIFIHMVKLFFKDIRLMLIFVLLMITLIDTIPTILLIIRSIKKKLYPTKENELAYSSYYKTGDFRIELRKIYNKNTKKFITTILFLLNILLISRIKPLFKRTWPFFIQFFKKCRIGFINLIWGKEKIGVNDKISEMPLIIISEICSFLDVNDINNLNQSNKKLNEKTNINYIWENIFYKKYDKLLKEALSDDEYNKFSHTKFETFKESCKNSCFILLAKKGKNIEKIMTFSEIVWEETIKSILNLIYLLLLPLYILIYIIKYINIILYEIYNILTVTFNIAKIYEKTSITNLYNDNTINSILINIYRFLFILFQIIIICYALFLIPQAILAYILEILNLIIYHIYFSVNNLFAINRLYEETLITNIYDDRTSNLILMNIKLIFICIFQILIIGYTLFLIPLVFFIFILKSLNLILYRIYDILVNIFNTKRFYDANLIDIYNDRGANPIIVNIKLIFIFIYQIIIICYTVFLIPQIFLIKCLSCNFSTEPNNIRLNIRVQRCTFIMFIM